MGCCIMKGVSEQCMARLCLTLLNLLLVISFPLETIFSDHTKFYSVSLHIYSETLYAKVCGSCSRNCTKHIQIVLPEYVPYNFSNMIRIFLHFFLM